MEEPLRDCDTAPGCCNMVSSSTVHTALALKIRDTN